MQNNMGSDYICVTTHAIGCLKGVKALLELERSRDACEKEPSRDLGSDLSAGTEKDPGLNSNVELN